jgi:hypothetical protein
MSQNHHQQAVDLMIESIYKTYPSLRNRAAKDKCDVQLDRVQEQLLDFLYKLR